MGKQIMQIPKKRTLTKRQARRLLDMTYTEFQDFFEGEDIWTESRLFVDPEKLDKVLGEKDISIAE